MLAPAARPERPFPELTERETEILDRIAAGRNNAQIAAELYLSPKTIRNNVTSILAKLQATDRAEIDHPGPGRRPRHGRLTGRRPPALRHTSRGLSASERMTSAVTRGAGAPGETRTHTGRHLKTVPLPLGYGRAGSV